MQFLQVAPPCPQSTFSTTMRMACQPIRHTLPPQPLQLPLMTMSQQCSHHHRLQPVPPVHYRPQMTVTKMMRLQAMAIKTLQAWVSICMHTDTSIHRHKHTQTQVVASLHAIAALTGNSIATIKEDGDLILDDENIDIPSGEEKTASYSPSEVSK